MLDQISNVHSGAHQLRLFVDGLAGVVAFGAVVGLLPSIAAILTIIWTSIQIFTWIRRQLLARRKEDFRND